jgi:hypothetical protein
MISVKKMLICPENILAGCGQMLKKIQNFCDILCEYFHLFRAVLPIKQEWCIFHLYLKIACLPQQIKHKTNIKDQKIK